MQLRQPQILAQYAVFLGRKVNAQAMRTCIAWAPECRTTHVGWGEHVPIRLGECPLAKRISSTSNGFFHIGRYASADLWLALARQEIEKDQRPSAGF